MEILGSDFLTIVKNGAVVEDAQVALTFADLDFKSLFAALDTKLNEQVIVRVEVAVAELIAAEPVKFSLETEAINLPTRYVNALEKLIDEETVYPVNLYMIVEHPLVSQSGMLIQKSASLAAYLDDKVSVQKRIEDFFNDQLTLINDGGWTTLVKNQDNK